MRVRERVQTGLGLSIVFGIVELHGAGIEVESQPGQGTCFRLRRPADEVVQRADTTSGDDPSPVRGHEAILLVDDEESVRRLARRGLELHGHHVIEATNGSQALERYRENPSSIDLALVDFTMLGRDGVQIIRALREHTPQLPAISMSGYLNRDGLGGPEIDAVLLPKPFRPDELAATVRRTLDDRLESGIEAKRTAARGMSLYARCPWRLCWR
jgi:CheY-like chemotaxis protein